MLRYVIALVVLLIPNFAQAGGHWHGGGSWHGPNGGGGHWHGGGSHWGGRWNRWGGGGRGNYWGARRWGWRGGWGRPWNGYYGHYWRNPWGPLVGGLLLGSATAYGAEPPPEVPPVAEPPVAEPLSVPPAAVLNYMTSLGHPDALIVGSRDRDCFTGAQGFGVVWKERARPMSGVVCIEGNRVALLPDLAPSVPLEEPLK